MVILCFCQELLNNIPEFSIKVRDSLELLQGKERFDISIIKGLRGILTKLNDRPLGRVGGGFSYIHMDRHFYDDETPTGTVNGTNKDFVLAKIPNPPVSLKVYRG